MSEVLFLRVNNSFYETVASKCAEKLSTPVDKLSDDLVNSFYSDNSVHSTEFL